MDAELFKQILKAFLSCPKIMLTFYDPEASYFWRNYMDLLMISLKFTPVPQV